LPRVSHKSCVIHFSADCNNMNLSKRVSKTRRQTACFSDLRLGESYPDRAALATLPFNSVFCFARSRRLPLHIRWIIRAAASEGFDVIDHITPAHAMCPADDLHSSIELVRRAIQDRLTGHCPTIDAIAQALHMSSLGCRSATEREHLQCRKNYSKTYGPLCGYGNTEPSLGRTKTA
jgi:hypothetical protein